MYRCFNLFSRALWLLLGALLGSLAQASSIDHLALGDPFAASQFQPTGWLALQQDLYSDLYSVGNSRGDALFALPRTDADIQYSYALDTELPGDNPIAGSVAAEVPTVAPGPTPLWILGVGMIGLSAVGRRRSQHAPASV